ncbi:hypothetical protein GDO81_025194 [Engystomops pustulosus]|uniref:Uncharacterized protein n=1 Tax=Engystomops pustulosus TaxID=76066 RepID=A0AAV6YSP7_ENGPU|nr:hypothetical protein GDO81_025194 [Engystomops pustulosus]
MLPPDRVEYKTLCWVRAHILDLKESEQHTSSAATTINPRIFQCLRPTAFRASLKNCSFHYLDTVLPEPAQPASTIRLVNHSCGLLSMTAPETRTCC